MNSATKEAIITLNNINDFDHLIQAIDNKKIIMIGDGSHGTDEFYKLRADLTKKLITEKGVNFIVIEWDWPDVYRINQYINGVSNDKSSQQSLDNITRFPLWMWRNQAVIEFIEWLKNYNDVHPNNKVAIYGLDLYSLFKSMERIINYLVDKDNHLTNVAKFVYQRLTKNRNNQSSEDGSYSSDKQLLDGINYLSNILMNSKIDDQLFDIQQNLHLIRDAIQYYQNLDNDDLSWYLRDKHMYDTLIRLINYYHFKHNYYPTVVVWTHNSHMGDSYYIKEFSNSRVWNLAQFIRNDFGPNCFNIGFLTFNGTVTAATQWNSPMKTMTVPPAVSDSYEYLFHNLVHGNFILIFNNNSLTEQLLRPHKQRFIGAVYNHDQELKYHYFTTILPQEFNSIIFLDQTNAVIPLDRGSVTR